MSDDLTKPQGDQYDTTPGVTAILERINHVHTDLVEQINGVRVEMNQNDSAILDLVGEVRTELIERINQVHAEARQNHSTVLTHLNNIEGQVRLTNARLDVDRED